MKKLTKAGIGWSGLMDNLVPVVEEWAPGELSDELKYRNSLADYLRECAPEARIEKEYRDGGTTADLFLKWQGIVQSEEVFFELKYNLSKKAAYDRLIGQVHALDPKKRNILIVLCGKTDPALAGRLKDQLREYESGINDWDYETRIVLK